MTANWGGSDTNLPATLVEKMTAYRKLYADILAVVAEMDHTRIVEHAGYPSLAMFLGHLLHVNTADARRMVIHAEHVTETRTPTGHVRDATLPTVRHALHKGELDPRHLDAVTDTLAQLPVWATTEHREILESTLAETARTSTPRIVREHGRILLDRIDQDGTEPRLDELAATTNVFHCRRTTGGGITFRGHLDPETAGTLEALLGPLAKPQPQEDGVPDLRTPEQRCGDGLAAVIQLTANCGDAPTRGGAQPHLTVTMDYRTLVEQIGTATLTDGTTLPAATARRLACDAQIVPMVLGSDSIPLDVGRTHRLVQPHQRNALTNRDRGCAFPSCHLPARWTDAHHIIGWAAGGPTDLDNLVLLCAQHHRLIHHSHWTIRMTNGTPRFVPPPEIDPAQQPRRNILRQ